MWFLRKRAFSVRDRPSLAGEPLHNYIRIFTEARSEGLIELKLVRKPPKVSRGYGGVARLPVQPGSPDFRGALSYNGHFWVCVTSPDRAWSGIEHLWEFWPWRGSFRCDVYSAWSGIGHLWEFEKTFLSCDFDGGVADILWSHSVQKT